MTKKESVRAALFGGALACAGLANAQELIPDTSLGYTYIWFSGYNDCPPPYDGYLFCLDVVQIFGDVLPNNFTMADDVAVGGLVYAVESGPTFFGVTTTPAPPNQPDDLLIFERGYANVGFTLSDDATIQYEMSNATNLVISVDNILFGSGPDGSASGIVNVKAGNRIRIGGFALREGVNFSVGIIGGVCNLADVAQPFGVLDLADVDAFIAAYLVPDPLADLVPPFGLYDLSDINAFVSNFVAGCP
ncbi:MAG: GC-type dockerin domain-anchored protein [Pseudomonadota bacterium]